VVGTFFATKNVTLLTLDRKTGAEKVCRDLSDAGIRHPTSHVMAFEQQDGQMVAVMSDGTYETFDVVYPVLGCNRIGCLEVDAHQQTTVEGLYAVGDVVSDLHQIAVGTGHAAVAATHIHNNLPRNFR
jgi:thioredoxin reductase (NADPH)